MYELYQKFCIFQFAPNVSIPYKSDNTKFQEPMLYILRGEIFKHEHSVLDARDTKEVCVNSLQIAMCTHGIINIYPLLHAAFNRLIVLAIYDNARQKKLALFLVTVRVIMIRKNKNQSKRKIWYISKSFIKTGEMHMDVRLQWSLSFMSVSVNIEDFKTTKVFCGDLFCSYFAC